MQARAGPAGQMIHREVVALPPHVFPAEEWRAYVNAFHETWPIQHPEEAFGLVLTARRSSACPTRRPSTCTWPSSERAARVQHDDRRARSRRRVPTSDPAEAIAGGTATDALGLTDRAPGPVHSSTSITTSRARARARRSVLPSRCQRRTIAPIMSPARTRAAGLVETPAIRSRPRHQLDQPDHDHECLGRRQPISLERGEL